MNSIQPRCWVVSSAVIALAWAGCSAGRTSDAGSGGEDPPPAQTPPVLDHVDHVIGTGSGQLIVSSVPGLKCGDIIGIRAGSYLGIALAHIEGEGCQDDPITVTNYEGQVRVIAENQGNWGFDIEDSSHVVVRAWDATTYGFYIKNTVGRVGFSIAGTSHDLDVSGLQIAEASHGIVVKEDPRCDRPDAWYPYVMRNFVLHDNLIENVLYEGFYLGYWNPDTFEITCNGSAVSVKAARLANVKVLRNVTRNTGNNGIKLRTCQDGGEIAYNEVFNYGLHEDEGWDSGITVGSATYGSIHHNHVERGHSTGIDVRSNVGTIQISQNTIIDAGTLPDGTKGQSWVRGRPQAAAPPSLSPIPQQGVGIPTCGCASSKVPTSLPSVNVVFTQRVVRSTRA